MNLWIIALFFMWRKKRWWKWLITQWFIASWKCKDIDFMMKIKGNRLYLFPFDHFLVERWHLNHKWIILFFRPSNCRWCWILEARRCVLSMLTFLAIIMILVFGKPFNYLFVVASILYFAIASPSPHEQEQDLKALQVARGGTRPTARAYWSYER